MPDIFGHALGIVFWWRWRGAHPIVDPHRIVLKLKLCRLDRARAIVCLIFKIRHPFLVYGGAAAIVAKEIERIDKFRADGRNQGYQPALRRSGHYLELIPVDIFHLLRVISPKFSSCKFRWHIPSARWRSSNDDDFSAAFSEIKEACAHGGERRIEMLKKP